MIDIEIKGLSDLQARLGALPEALQTKVLKGAVSTAAAIFKNQAIQYAPVYTGKVSEGHPPPGTLRDSIYQFRIKEESVGTREVWRVSVRKKKTADAYYATWVEYGHYTRGSSARSRSEREGVSSGSHAPLGTYFILAQPFMRPAFESKKTEAAEALRDYIATHLPDAMKALP